MCVTKYLSSVTKNLRMTLETLPGDLVLIINRLLIFILYIYDSYFAPCSLQYNTRGVMKTFNNEKNRVDKCTPRTFTFVFAAISDTFSSLELRFFPIVIDLLAPFYVTEGGESDLASI